MLGVAVANVILEAGVGQPLAGVRPQRLWHEEANTEPKVLLASDQRAFQQRRQAVERDLRPVVGPGDRVHHPERYRSRARAQLRKQRLFAGIEQRVSPLDRRA